MGSTPVAIDRAVSAVVSVVLLIAIAVLLAIAIGTAVFGMDAGAAEAPEVTVSFEVVDGTVELRHEGGDPLVADEIVVLDQDGTARTGLDHDLTAGDSDVIVETLVGVERVTVVWRDPQSSTESVLATFKL